MKVDESFTNQDPCNPETPLFKAGLKHVTYDLVMAGATGAIVTESAFVHDSLYFVL